MMRALYVFLCGFLVAVTASTAHAGEHFCSRQTPQNKAERAAQIACAEHQLWREPFINAQGRLLKIGPMEAERDSLTDGSPAWQRVYHYWQNSVGVQDLFRHTSIPNHPDSAVNTALTRVQLVDTPWSGAFISYVMRQAGFTQDEFNFADGHIRYIKPAFANPQTYGFTPKNPLTTRMQTGDLLCYVREAHRVFGAQGFVDWMSEHSTDEASLKMHCDIVVGIFGKGKNQRAHTVGGNVVQSVTMRELQLTWSGALAKPYFLPTTQTGSWLVDALSEDAPMCSLSTTRYCNMNRQDWVILLRAKK